MVGGAFFFQAEDGIRYLVRSRGLGDVYKRQVNNSSAERLAFADSVPQFLESFLRHIRMPG